MNKEQFSLWGAENGLERSWTLSQLDSLLYAQFLVDFSPYFSLQTNRQLNEFILSGSSEIWDDQNLLFDFLLAKKYPHRLWKPQVLKKVFTETCFSELKSYVQKVNAKPDFLTWCDIFMRHALYNSSYLQQLHVEIIPKVEAIVGRKLVSTYSFLSLYGEHGICPPHREHSGCQWTLQLCLAQDKPWPIYVENDSFLMEENEALIYSGLDQLHWREQIHPKGFCHLVFFHFKEA